MSNELSCTSASFHDVPAFDLTLLAWQYESRGGRYDVTDGFGAGIEKLAGELAVTALNSLAAAQIVGGGVRPGGEPRQELWQHRRRGLDAVVAALKDFVEADARFNAYEVAEGRDRGRPDVEYDWHDSRWGPE